MKLCGLVSALALSLGLASATLTAAAPVPPEDYSALRWRLVGPLRGGWGTCASGVPGQPETFYFGAADGGVWKTTDAGRTWNPLFEHETAGSIGALAVAPSDPRVLYVGTGQVTSRWDIASGHGVYRSTDGGKTWEARGLAESKHIGRLWVDPRNADVVLAAVQGHFFGPSPERGVFRSSDGGRSWEKVLFVDENSGAVDLAADPAAPDTIFAATWQVRYYPWLSYFTPNVGPGSGLFKSTDGGKTWARLTEHGLPGGTLGRIGLAVAPGSQGQRVYATIAATPGAGLYRSDDGGGSWQYVNPNGGFASDYFSSITVDPKQQDTLYVMGQSIRRSTDGGKTFDFFRGAPGGDDYHFLWIDPERTERMIVASDQGTVVTVNGGGSWSSWYNQPTGQFYHVATDDRFPYWLYSGQQDSGTVRVASRSDYGQLTFRDWHPVGGDERDYDIPFPGDPDVVFGSGLGGRLSRWDGRTGQVSNVAPWPISSYGARPTSVRYRSTWITPLAISALPPHAIYLGAQVLFRSTDQGQHWETVSPDLSGAVPNTPDCATGDVPLSRARACGFGVISTIAPSPIDKDLVWVGTDDGLIHVTRDGGKSWKNVTPPGLAEWSRLAQIDASATAAGTAYAAVDRHRLDDDRPYLYITHDFGKTWRAAISGLPAEGWVAVVRQDRVKAGLLFAGTSRGAFVSFNDGEAWRPLQLNLPTTGVNDLTIHGDDLVAATEGRSLWILDDIAPLRHLGEPMTAATLLPPATAYRVGANQNRDTPLPLDEPRTFNPPAGAILDYVLPASARGPVALEIVDAQGKVVRAFSSAETPKRPEAGQYFDDDWLQPLKGLPASPGHNRFVWNLRGPRPRALEYEYSIAAVPGADTPELPQGLFALPGTYQVRLTVDGKTTSQPLTVAMDPRVKTPRADLVAQHEMYVAVSAALARVTDAQEEVQAVSDRLKKLDGELAGRAGSEALREQARHATADVAVFQSSGGRRAARGEESLAAVAGVLSPLATDLESSDSAPTTPQREVFDLYKKRLDSALAKWEALRKGELHDLDQKVRAAGLAPVVK
jgi:photosystem II stability/assembly factor-like uncharacterized protein